MATLTKKDIQELLNGQTTVILDAVSERLVTFEVKINKKLEAMEARWNKKLDKLIATLDKFVGRLDSMDTEFTMMKNDMKRMKQVIKEKLGVEL